MLYETEEKLDTGKVVHCRTKKNNENLDFCFILIRSKSGKRILKTLFGSYTLVLTEI